MEVSTYEVEAQVEKNHWWFWGRRVLFKNIIDDLSLSKSSSVLDLGTSTGTNLRLLADMKFSNFKGLDMSDEAIRFCAEKNLGQVMKGDICQIPVADNTLDFVMATDIIEHVDNDQKAIAEIERVLKKGGHALITVPTFESLWGLQDDISHHKRRYRLNEFKQKLLAGGFKIHQSFYFNYLLFLPIFLARQMIALLGLKLKSENQLNNPLVNFLFKVLFWLDIKTAPYLRPPFGVSALVLVSKPSSETH